MAREWRDCRRCTAFTQNIPCIQCITLRKLGKQNNVYTGWKQQHEHRSTERSCPGPAIYRFYTATPTPIGPVCSFQLSLSRLLFSSVHQCYKYAAACSFLLSLSRMLFRSAVLQTRGCLFLPSFSFSHAVRSPVLQIRAIRYLYIIIIHSFYIALFSALEQTHCAHVACYSE